MNSVEYDGDKAVNLLVDKDKLGGERERISVDKNQFTYLATPQTNIRSMTGMALARDCNTTSLGFDARSNRK